MNIKHQIIGIAGPAGAGKSTVANILFDLFSQSGYDPMLMGFADSLKRMVVTLMVDAGYSKEEAELYCFGPSHLREEVVMIGGVKTTARELCQTLGTEWGRNCISDSIWVEAAMSVACGYCAESAWNIVLMPDVRFQNEVEAITDRGGFIFEVRREGLSYGSGHESEAGIQIPMRTGLSIYNDSTLATLELAITRLARDHILA